VTIQNRLPDPSKVQDNETREYLNMLIRDLHILFSAIINDENSLTYKASRRVPFDTITETTTLGRESSIVLIDATGGNITVYLPDPLGFKRQFLRIKRIDASGNTVTVTGIGDELPLNLSTMDSYTLYSDGENFWLF
jgi:hypothetical protein